MLSSRFLITFKFGDAAVRNTLGNCPVLLWQPAWTVLLDLPLCSCSGDVYSAGLTFHRNAMRECFSVIGVPLGKSQLPRNKSGHLGIVQSLYLRGVFHQLRFIRGSGLHSNNNHLDDNQHLFKGEWMMAGYGGLKLSSNKSSLFVFVGQDNTNYSLPSSQGSAQAEKKGREQPSGGDSGTPQRPPGRPGFLRVCQRFPRTVHSEILLFSSIIYTFSNLKY